MKFSKYIMLLFFSATLILSCGGNEKKEGEQQIKIGTNKKATETKTKDDTANLVITGDDLMKYNKTELKVKAGQKVKLTLRHIGKLDVNVMGHNVVILKKGVDLTAFATKAATQKDNGYLPKDTKDVIAHTKMIGGGQTTSIEFIAPEAGEYVFFCSFPAHFALMKGKFIVE